MPSGVYIRTKPLSKEARKKISIALQGNINGKGNIPWNKGLKGEKNYWYGKHHTELTKKKISIKKTGVKQTLESIQKRIAHFIGDKHWYWKGDNSGYRNIHIWIENHYGKPDTCEFCGKSGLSGHQIHWANISGEYKREITDWIRLCTKCHGAFDTGKILSISLNY